MHLVSYHFFSFLKHVLSHNSQDKSKVRELAEKLKVIRDEPENARAHFEIGVLYDQLNDGASAIIHSRIAERLFIQQKDVKGTAETRRNLRHYFKKYDFQPEDFVLAPLQVGPGS